MRALTLGMIAALSLSACATVPGDDVPATPSASPLTGYTWQLQSGPASLTGTDNVQMVFKTDGTFGVTGLCNRVGGKYTDEGGKVTFSGVAMTMMACADPRVMKLEQEVGAQLAKPASIMMTRSIPPQLRMNFEGGTTWSLQGAK